MNFIKQVEDEINNLTFFFFGGGLSNVKPHEGIKFKWNARYDDESLPG